MRLGPLRRAAWSVMGGLLSLAVLILFWYSVIWMFHMGSFFAKTPVDVAHFLIWDPNAAANRHSILAPLMATLRDAGVGFVVGTGAAIVIAVVFRSVPFLRTSLLPIVLALQSTPMLAMIPVIVLVFGRGLGGVVVVTGLVTFFPTLINVLVAMGRRPSIIGELFVAYNAPSYMFLTKLELPFATPALLASMRIAIPRALLGALLVEWLATGTGLGYAMVLFTTSGRFTQLWASVAILCLVSLVGYSVLAVFERFVLAYFGFQTER